MSIPRDVRLQTERLLLREHALSDVDDVFAYASSSEVTQFTNWDSHPDQHATRDELQKWISTAAMHPRRMLMLAIVATHDSNQVIGELSLERQSSKVASAEIGFALHPQWWSKGYSTEAAQALVDFAFDRLHLARVAATVDPENFASVRVLEKLGMQMMACVDDAYEKDGELRPMLVYALYREDRNMTSAT